MTNEQALAILQQVSDVYLCNKADRQTIDTAVSTLKTAITPKPEPEATE